MSSIAPNRVHPVGEFRLKIAPSTKVATGGSCFAQHISRHLQSAGYNYYVAETGHPIIPSSVLDAHHYGTFSARFGNIYTTRQLVQLFDRAHRSFSPSEDVWIEADGRVLDPFRPTIQPRGFASEEEMRADRDQHLRCVREMFRSLEVFIFTLGLTECWRSRNDGAVFPICPGVEGGAFDPSRHEFYNMGVEDVASDLSAFVHRLREVNPSAEILLTVSPVPLVATASPGEHVLSATVYSKSVLRVAAEMARKSYENVHYFPSYEIITGAFSRGDYFGADLRSVTEVGVSHVMRCFFDSVGAVNQRPTALTSAVARGAPASTEFSTVAASVIEVECDEVALDPKK